MIEIIDLVKKYRSRHGVKTVFSGLSFTIPSNKNVAIIGRNGAGKSTLLRLLAGIDSPDKGRIRCTGRISWPVGLTGGLQGSMTGRDNVRFVSRIQGASKEETKKIICKVMEFADIGEFFDRPINTYSSGMKGRLGFGLSLAFDFEYYLVDEAMSVGDAHFKAKAAAAVKEKLGSGNIILVTHGMSQVKAMCDIVVLLRDGKAEIYEDVDAGIFEYRKA